jgi:hypothetical protein
MSYVLLDPDPARKRKRARKRRARTVRVIALDPEPARRWRRVRRALARAKGILTRKNLMGFLGGFMGFSTLSHVIEKWKIRPLGYEVGVIPYRTDVNNKLHYIGADDLLSAGAGIGLGYALSKKIIPSIIGAIVGLFVEKEGEVKNYPIGNPHNPHNPHPYMGGGGFKPYEVV